MVWPDGFVADSWKAALGSIAHSCSLTMVAAVRRAVDLIDWQSRRTQSKKCLDWNWSNWDYYGNWGSPIGVAAAAAAVASVGHRQLANLTKVAELIVETHWST